VCSLVSWLWTSSSTAEITPAQCVWSATSHRWSSTTVSCKILNNIFHFSSFPVVIKKFLNQSSSTIVFWCIDLARWWRGLWRVLWHVLALMYWLGVLMTETLTRTYSDVLTWSTDCWCWHGRVIRVDVLEYCQSWMHCCHTFTGPINDYVHIRRSVCVCRLSMSVYCVCMEVCVCVCVDYQWVYTVCAWRSVSWH